MARILIASKVLTDEKLLFDTNSKLSNILYQQRILTGIKKIRKILNNNSTKILFKKLGREQAWGLFDITENTICIDPRQYLVKSIVSTICHEMIHAEQAQQGRLQIYEINKRSSIFEWRENNAIIKYHSRRMLKNNRYKQLPWEAEAYKREPLLLKAIGKF